MKTYLIDPRKRWCKANLHCHTTNSDGFFTPEQIKELYKSHGYQIVAYTDHDVIFDVSYLTDEEFVAITSSEFSFYRPKGPANTTYADPNLVPPKWRDGPTVHLTLFAKNPHNTFHVCTAITEVNPRQKELYKPNEIQCDGYPRVICQKDIQMTIDRANEAGFLTQFNHPNWSLNTREDYIHLKGLWALEILNYATDLETSADYCPNIYEDMLRNGHKIVPTMGDDNHNRNGSLYGSFGGFDYIGVDHLTYDEVLAAMEQGDIYSSSGPIIRELWIDPEERIVHIETSEVGEIFFIGYNRLFRRAHGENITSADFKIEGNEFYFHITIRDKNGKVAHTKAYYLEDYGIHCE